MRPLRNTVAAFLVWLLSANAVWAQVWWFEPPVVGLPSPSVGSSLPHRGDPGGARKWLGDRGVIFGLEYTSDVLSNVSGGQSLGTIYQGKLQGVLTIDFSKLGLEGLSLFTNFFQI